MDNTVEVSEENIDELIQFFNNCRLPQDENKLKVKLQETTEARRKIHSQQIQSYPKICDFYLVDPKLVIIVITSNNMSKKSK